jgi:signal transduction histidine kinase
LIDTPIKINESFLVKIIEEAIDNAIKFSSPISTINVNSSLEGNKYVLSIKNYGVGMSESDVEAIQPFLQFQRSVQEQQGMGLGLAIIFKVMSIFGGSAEISSEKDDFFEIILKFQLSDVSVEDFLQS